MKFINTFFEDLWLIEPEIKNDSRGFFSRIFCLNEFQEIGLRRPFVQENLTLTKKKGTFRGLHFQVHPYSEIKLVRCIRGNVFDIVVDLRANSKTFLKVFGTELNEKELNMLLIPEGFAHGFQTLSENCLMLYLHSNFYNSRYERGVRYDEPQISIKLPLPIGEISERDINHPFLSNDFKGIIL